MTAAAAPRKLQALLKRLRGEYGEAAPAPVMATLESTPAGADPVVHELVYSTLLWESTAEQARPALRRLFDGLTDYNEVRVCLADELMEQFGAKYPMAHERALRLKMGLNDIFRRFHRVALEGVADAKRDGKSLVMSVEGLPAFARARTALVMFDAHALPVDEKLLALLTKEGVVPEDSTEEAAASWLERHIRAGEAGGVHGVLQAWSDEHGQPPKESRRAQPVLSLLADAEHKARAPRSPKSAARKARPGS